MAEKKKVTKKEEETPKNKVTTRELKVDVKEVEVTSDEPVKAVEENEKESVKEEKVEVIDEKEGNDEKEFEEATKDAAVKGAILPNVEVEDDEKEEEKEEDDDKEEKDDKDEQDEDKEEQKEEVKEEEKVPSFGPIDYGEDKKKGNFLWKIIYIIAFLIGVVGAIFIYQNYISDMVGKQSVKEDVAPTETPTPTEVEVDLGEYPIEVQNGSGAAGVAGTASDFLEEQGFTVGETDNADNFDYTETVIQAGSSVPQEVITQLKQALETEYVVASEVEEIEDNTALVVIIGSETTE